MTLSSTRRVAAVVACVTLLAVTPPSSVFAQTFPGRLTVRVYDFSVLDTPVRHSAIDEARGIVAGGGIAADWHDCRRVDACAPEPGDLVIRIVRETRTSGLEWRRTLGFSVLDPIAGAGTLATVFINRVEDSARHAGANAGLLLGRAIAHEVCHLILRTNEHGDDGLMRAVWTEQEMARNAPDDWVFAAAERRLLRAALQRTGRSAAR
jgi:hypothetical protein